MQCSSHPARFNHPNNNKWKVWSIKFALCDFLYPPVTISLMRSNILFVFSNTRCLNSVFTARNEVPIQYETEYFKTKVSLGLIN
jgi:hypothetical protein